MWITFGYVLVLWYILCIFVPMYTSDVEDAYDNDNAETIVEHLCGNLIGQTVLILNVCSINLNKEDWTEVLVEKVDNGYLYGVCNGNKIDIYLPYVYVYHPAILAALKCL